MSKAVQKQNDNKELYIFLDLDGVLADFDLHAHQENKYKPDGKLDYDRLDYKWWSTIPVCEGAKEFYKEARKLGTVRFLTGPMASEACFSGKAHWVQNFVPKRKRILKELIICASADKDLIAAPNRILVDDRERNIKDWQAAGGIGIHHDGDLKATLKKLQDTVVSIRANDIKSPAKKSSGPKTPRP